MFNRVSKSDIKILIIFFLIFIGSFSVLYFDLFNQQNSDSDRPIIAQTTEIQNDVRVKTKDQFAWSYSKKNSDIRYGDQLFTGEKSKVTVRLLDGQKINIQQNSLVKFDQKKNVKNFKIVFGSLSTQVKKDEMIEITICGKKHIVKSESDDELTISNNDNCAKPEVKFKKSIAIVAKVKKNRVIAQVANQILEKRKPAPIVPVSLAQPVLKKSSIKMAAKLKTKKIRWDAVANADSYFVQVMNKDDLSRIIIKAETKDLFFEFTPIDDIDKYSYSVEARSLKPDFLPTASPIGQIAIVHSPVKVVKPVKSFELSARTSGQLAKPIDVSLEWEKTPRAQSYKIEIAEDEEFQKITETIKAKTNSQTIKLNDFGKRHYRVTAYSPSGKELTRSDQSAYIEYNKKFDLLAPVIDEKSKNQSLFFQKTEGKFIRLAWQNKQVKKAPNHYIEISDKDDFSKIVKTYSTKKQYIFLNESIAEGKYFWRVKSYGADVISNWSDTGLLKIKSNRAMASEKK